MIRIFTGDDRIAAGKEIEKLLGKNHETIDCTDLTEKDLPSIFLGTTLFETRRYLLLRDFTANVSLFRALPQYLNTPHEVILLETKLDRRSATYKELKDRLEIKEFKLLPTLDFRQVFDIYKVAKNDGLRAVAMLRKIEQVEDPIRFTGLLASQALKDYQIRPGSKEKQILKSLGRTDLEMKSSKIDPWLLVESFLLNLSKI